MRRVLKSNRLKAALWLCLLLLAGCNLRQGNVINTPFPTPDIPRVRFLYPDNNSTVLEGTDLQIDVLAEDPGSGIAHVEARVDDTLLDDVKPQDSAAVPTFTVRFHWLAQGTGKHALTAIAYRADGRASDPATLVIEVLPRPVATEGQ